MGELGPSYKATIGLPPPGVRSVVTARFTHVRFPPAATYRYEVASWKAGPAELYRYEPGCWAPRWLGYVRDLDLNPALRAKALDELDRARHQEFWRFMAEREQHRGRR